jgi:hypothetical protein
MLDWHKARDYALKPMSVIAVCSVTIPMTLRELEIVEVAE